MTFWKRRIAGQLHATTAHVGNAAFVSLTAKPPSLMSFPATRPPRVRVRLRAAPTTLDAMDVMQVVPYVDASDLSVDRGAHSVPVRVRGIPEGVELVDVEPADVLATPARS